jgi:Arc/MetJ family transcription regulator
MGRTEIDLDDALVSEAARALGTCTTSDTVNRALREVLETRRRTAALARLRKAAADGAFDLEMLEGKKHRLP